MAGRSGKHAGERFLVTLDKDICAKLTEIAELEGLALATKARQILTMYVNGISYVPTVNASALEEDKKEEKSTSTSIFDDESWMNN